MEPRQLLLYLAAGACLGVIGQVARLLVGVKKRFEEAMARKKRFKFNVSRLAIGIGLGGVAGALSSLLLGDRLIDQEYILSVVAAGYAGTDFIEGAIQRVLPRV